MNYFVLFPLLVGFAVDPISETTKKELQKLEGDWKVVKAVTDKIIHPKEELIVTIKGETIQFIKTRPSYRFQIDPSKDPKWIDIDFSGLKHPGIYKVEGDQLTLYLINEFRNGNPYDRPRKFDKKAHGQILHLERIKKK